MKTRIQILFMFFVMTYLSAMGQNIQTPSVKTNKAEIITHYTALPGGVITDNACAKISQKAGHAVRCIKDQFFPSSSPHHHIND